MAAYAEDLVYVHDVGFGAFSREAAPALLRLLERHGIRDGLVVDLGCGTGIWAEALSRAGYDVMGVDLSPAMLRVAKQRVARGRFVRASVLDVELPPCSAVTALGEVMCYAFDPRNSLRALDKLFRRIYRAFQPGGVFVFDVAHPGQLAPRREPERFWQGADWVLMRKAEETDGFLIRRMTIFRRVGRVWRRSDEVHRLRLYTRDEIRNALEEAGFRVRVVRNYGGTRLRSDMSGFIAIKPASGGKPESSRTRA